MTCFCDGELISGLEVKSEEEPKLRLPIGVAFDDEATLCFRFLFKVRPPALSVGSVSFPPLTVGVSALFGVDFSGAGIVDEVVGLGGPLKTLRA